MGGAPTAPLRTLQGRYRLTELLGHGARATVYRAEDLLLGRDVAVKVIEAASEDAAAVVAHEAEARRLASLTMHGLVTLLDAGVEREPGGPPRIFLVLELVEGTDLKRMLARGTLPPRHVAHIGFDVAEALQFMHDRGVVHQDVTPANVLLLDHGADRRPRVKLGDFGVQDIVGAAAAEGAYRSPELTGPARATPAADVYALGLVLLECLTGTVGPAALAAAPPDPWRSTLAAMLEPDPGARPDAETLVATFRRLLVEERGRHRGPERASSVEEARLAAVRAYGVLDTPQDAPFDRIANLAARVLDMPMAAIGILDSDRLWFKSRSGPLPPEVPRAAALHAALLDGETVDVADAGGAFAADPLVADGPGIRFAAAAPLTTPEGLQLGLLAVYDTVSRTSPDGAAATLEDFAAIVLHELELRRAARRAALARR